MVQIKGAEIPSTGRERRIGVNRPSIIHGQIRAYMVRDVPGCTSQTYTHPSPALRAAQPSETLRVLTPILPNLQRRENLFAQKTPTWLPSLLSMGQYIMLLPPGIDRHLCGLSVWGGGLVIH